MNWRKHEPKQAGAMRRWWAWRKGEREWFKCLFGCWTRQLNASLACKQLAGRARNVEAAAAMTAAVLVDAVRLPGNETE
jgi:hypothetical protein